MLKGLTKTFEITKLEFIENKIEKTLFNGDTAIETSIFTIKVTSTNGGQVNDSGSTG